MQRACPFVFTSTPLFCPCHEFPLNLQAQKTLLSSSERAAMQVVEVVQEDTALFQ